MKTTHTKQNKELKKEISRTKQSVKKRLILESILIIFIALTPFIYYLYEYIPQDVTKWKFIFTFKSGKFPNVYISFWVFISKLVPLYLLIFWFVTCKHWWYHIILVPIAMYAFQFFNAVNKSSQFIDEVEIYWVIPILMIISPIVYLIRLRLFDKLVLGIDLKKIDKELDEYDRKEKEAKNKIETK